jgi:transposase
MTFYGVDIAKDEFVVQGPSGRETVKNAPLEIRKWIKTLPKDAAIALESTGGYGVPLMEIAFRSKRTVYVLSPRQVASYRKSLGRRAKTDALDATLIRRFALTNHSELHPYQPWDGPLKQLRDLVRLRNRLAFDRARIAMRLKAFRYSMREIAKTVRGLKERMAELDKRIAERVKEYEEAAYVSSVRGVGPLTTAACLAALEQVPFQSADAFVAYAGLDLVVNDSGTSKGKRRISSWGDVTLRGLLYLAGKSAASSKEWEGYVAPLKRRGYKPIQIHCAVARKIARIVFNLYRNKQMFDPDKAFPKKRNAQPKLAKQT